MAIEYERVNWDTTKYVNPTNMNQMDAGIKAACDGVDENSSAITAINSTLPHKKTISATTDANGFFTLTTANETPIGIKNVKFDGVANQAKYEFMWNTNNTYAIKLMSWNNSIHANKNVTLDLIYVVV